MWLYKIGKVICRVLFSIIFHIEIYGTENCPKNKKGFILISNHTTALDPVFLGISCPRRIRFMAKEELFHTNFFFRWLITTLGAFSVSRGTGDSQSLNTGTEIVKSGDVMGIFPEGTRSKTGELLKFKSGAIVIAALTEGDILPVHICISKGRMRKKVIIRYGELINNKDLNVTDVHDLTQIKYARNLLMDSVQKLKNENEIKAELK